MKGTFMNMSRTVMVTLLFLAPVFAPHCAVAAEAAGGKADYSRDPAFGGHALNPEFLRKLVDNGYIPTRPPMSDLELAEKLNLNLPPLAPVKAAVEKKDAKALQAALAAYLNSRLAPAQVAPTGKPASNAAQADKWLAPEITFPTPYDLVAPIKYPLGEHMNWFLGWDECQGSMVSDWYWGPHLAEAYQSSGDPKYAERLILLARDFYPTGGRPPAQRPATWLGCGGPWRSQGLHTRLGYLAAAYRGIGAAPCVTDADRVMFLKMFWEHCDALNQLIDRPMVQNFAGAVFDLVDTEMIFPDFRDSPKWLERSTPFYGWMVNGMTSEDGSPLERSGYGYGVVAGLKRGWVKLQNAGAKLPTNIRQRLGKAFEYEIFLPTPTWLCPMFGHGTPIIL